MAFDFVVDLDDILAKAKQQELEADLKDGIYLALVSRHLEEYNALVEELLQAALTQADTLDDMLKARPEFRVWPRAVLEKGWEESTKEWHKSLLKAKDHLLRDLEWSVFAREEYQYLLNHTPAEKHIHTRADAHKRRG